MKKLIVCFLAALLMYCSVLAQLIPNGNFADAIRNQCSACIDANNYLLPAAQKLEKLDVYYKSVSNLQGIEGFTHLTELNCRDNPLITSLPDLPVTLLNLNIKNTGIRSIASFPPKLDYFYGDNSPVESLPELPPSLETLNCQNCGLTSLPALPESLLDLDIENCPVSVLPYLPQHLQMLNIRGTKIKTLPQFPNSLYSVWISDSTFDCIPSNYAALRVNHRDAGQSPIPFCKNDNKPIVKNASDPAIPETKKCISGNCNNGTGSLETDNAEGHSTYKGGFRNALYNGQGSIVVKDKYKYTGTFTDGKIEGKGVFTSFDKGFVYTGEFKNNAREGSGTLVFKDGRRSTGTWKDNRLWTGTGLFEYEDNGSYYGAVKENVPDGQGVRTFSKGEKFTGSFSKGNPMTGKGYFYYSKSKTSYEGAMINGKPSGPGIYTNPSGQVFTGNFTDGSLNGNGKWTDPKVGKYEGNFYSSNFDGYGVMTYNDGFTYKGNWANSKRNGNGSLYDANGNLKYSGNWKDDKKEEKKAEDEVYTKSLGLVEFYKPGDVDMDKGFSLCCSPVTEIRFPDNKGSFIVRVWIKYGFDNKKVILVLYDYDEDTHDEKRIHTIDVETQPNKEAVCYEVSVNARSAGTILVKAFLGTEDKDNFIGKRMLKTTIPFGK